MHNHNYQGPKAIFSFYAKIIAATKAFQFQFSVTLGQEKSTLLV